MKPLFAFRSLLNILLMFSYICLVTVLTTLPTQAHALAPSTSLISQKTSTKQITVMILDMSGSMSVNDPQGFRCSAAYAYIDLSSGNYIGVIGLDNNNGLRAGPHNFETSQVWALPTDTSTVQQRQILKQSIVSHSNNCRPDGTTPTYDALSQALTMLTTTNLSGPVSGSVILVTDGAPDPDANSQITAINADLLPQFQVHGWPIDTIFLGSDTGSRNFLMGITNATGGNFYADANGPVPGISPLNIAPFFMDIFARRNHITLTQTIPPTQLADSTSLHNFAVSDFTRVLDVFVVKDQPSINISLTAPNGETVTQNEAGIFAATDPHYAIFSIDLPQAGAWILRASGSGLFLMNSLIATDINVTITEPIALNTVFALGDPFLVSTMLTEAGQPLVDSQFTIIGNISYRGGAEQFSTNFALQYNRNNNGYEALLTLPSSAPVGSYEISIEVSNLSADNVISSASETIRVGLYAVPLLLSAQGSPTTGLVNTDAVEWDSGLQLLYGWESSFLTPLSRWPLNNLPALPEAAVSGRIYAGQQVFHGVSVTGTAQLEGSGKSNFLTVSNDLSGSFQITFPVKDSGTYRLILTTHGSAAIPGGSTTVTRSVRVSINPASLSQEIGAWTKTSLYFLCIILLSYAIRFFLSPRPFGTWKLYSEGDFVAKYNFQNSRRNIIQRFLQPNILYSEQAGMPRGLQFRFRHGNAIEMRAYGKTASDWSLSNGEKLTTRYQVLHELVNLNSTKSPQTYIFVTSKDRSRYDSQDDTLEYEY